MSEIKRPNESWNDYMQKAHKDLKQKEKNPILWRIKYLFRLIFSTK